MAMVYSVQRNTNRRYCNLRDSAVILVNNYSVSLCPCGDPLTIVKGNFYGEDFTA